TKGNQVELLSRSLYAPIMLNIIDMIGRTGRLIANLPETLNEQVPRVIAGKLQESFLFLLGDDVSDVFRQPITKTRRQRFDGFARRIQRAAYDDGQAANYSIISL